MRCLVDRIYKKLISVYFLLNGRRVKAVACCVYMIGAVVFTLSRQYLISLGQLWWQMPSLVALRAFIDSRITHAGVLLQRTEIIFR